MVTDQETDFVFLSDKLRAVVPFCQQLIAVLSELQVAWALLPETKDIWAVDYMPVQVRKNTFIQFRFDPDYLRSKKWAHTKTDPKKVSNAIGINTVQSDIVLDGGNVIKGKSWAILTDKIFLENPSYPRKALLEEIERLLEVKPIVIPREPHDFTGHADGMVRYYDESAVLINQYRRNENKDFRKKLFRILKDENLNTIEVPYWPHDNTSYISAIGIYTNYLHMQGCVLVPVFGIPEDDHAVSMFEQLFRDCMIRTVYARKIAAGGGVLNCISWNIKS